jgi:hypothetical protein
MRFRIFSVVTGLALAIGVAVAVSTAGASRPISPTGAAAHGTAAPAPNIPDTLVTLVDNNNNDSGVGISSQNFEASFDAYDDQAADDFKVPVGHKWKVKKVIVTGVYYNGSGPAVSENVFFYKKSGTLPGILKAEFDNVVGVDNGTGSFTISLPSNAVLSGGLTGSGKTYWVSVQVNMDFNSGGQWGWEGSLNTLGNPDAWQNPGNGFGTGCTTWGVETSCIGDFGQGPSKMFALRGVDVPL